MAIALRVLLVLTVLSLTSCFGPTGKVRVKTDLDKAELYIDGEFKGQLSKDYVEFELSAKEHLFEVKHLSDDEEWKYFGEKTLVVMEDATSELRVTTRSSATEKRKKRLQHEAKLRDAETLAKKVRTYYQQQVTHQGAN